VAHNEALMLGELIEETTGKRVGRKVISNEPLVLEVTCENTGKLLGKDVMEIGTYISRIRPDGSIYAEGQGVYMTGGGDTISWKRSAVGLFGESGTVNYRGATYYSTTSPNFTRLNSVAGIFELHADAVGALHTKAWEWK
jgi:hypothetical protein